METNENNNLHREITCILFPGIVKNVDKALQCMGGIRGISQVYSQPTKKRLGLSFQPENPYVKKIYGDAKKASGVLLSVKVKKTKNGSQVKREVVSTTIVGSVKKIYKFEVLCDFQFLPVSREGCGTSPPKCIIEDILPSGLHTSEFLSQPSPLFIVPSSFTRSDRPINYTYTDKRYFSHKDTPENTQDDEVRRTRTERSIPLARYRFTLTDELPSEPHEYYIKRKDVKFAMCPEMEQDYETIKKLFEERPIWSLNLVRYQTKIKIATLKIVMPCLALYMKNGPWRMLWVKFGYDPRKEPGARIYQTLDFRLRAQAGVNNMVMTRDQLGHYKKADRVRYSRKRMWEEPSVSEEICEGAVYFRPGMAPSQRQIFYQYCDIKLPEVEAMLATEPPPGFLCHEKRGWLPANTDDASRDHIFKYVKQTLLSTYNSDLTYDVRLFCFYLFISSARGVGRG
ncbi:general transcription factor 3C polypeptide 5 [Epargyreus clarus]|uniref:general transcription factor 3C polypeptide 5 n=1 Tax=Epargyreus clarus TaxID=520877 RepID=UPI003C2C7085